MIIFPRARRRAALILLLAASMPLALLAQTSAERAAANPLGVFPFDRAIRAIDDRDSVVLPDHVHPMATPANDAGRVPGAFPMNRMILTLTRSPEQAAAAEAYAAALQNLQSPFFHQWLTPEEFGAHFGLSGNDLDRISAWLRRLGFTIDEIPSGHWSITFSGTAAQVENAFHTTIRFYNVAGEIHHANASNPQIPRALSGIVSGVSGLHNFRARRGVATPQPAGGPNGGHYLDPSDFATIYNVNPLYNQGIKGNGIAIAVIEDCSTDFSTLSLAQTYWQLEGIPQGSNAVWNYGTPRTCGSKDYDELFLDYEWAGALAPQSTVWLVSSGASDSLLGAVQGVVEHGVNNGFAHVITMSYEDCESQYDFNNWVPIWLQAHTQGITGLVSSGDIGAAACDYPGDTPTATHGRAVSGFCASPWVVCVGGTQFDDVANQSQYWSAAGRALGYIPETAWNESGTLGKTPTTWGSSGGGYSAIQTKPAWQTGNTTALRGEPDVALSSASHDAYRICQPDPNVPCTSNYYWSVAGTSAAAPSFAGIMALVIQATGQKQGNPNQTFYGLAAQPNLGVFHDIVTGNNSVNGVGGYPAGPGWDAVTGLGSVDANALVKNWPGASVSGPGVTLSTSQLTFGNQALNTASAAQTVKVTNSGSSTLSVSSITISEASGVDFTGINGCVATVAAGASCTISVTFKPTAAGLRSASLAITDNAPGSPHTVALSGNGITSGIPFRNQRVSTTAPPASGCVVPPSVTSFLTSNNTVYLYFEATVTTADNLTLKWLAPNGDLLDGGGWQTASGLFCDNEQLDISNPKPGHLGAWQAIVFDNGAQLFAVPFTVSAPGTALQFLPVAPCRIMDTRNPNGTFGGPFIGRGTSRTIPVPSSTCGVPASAKAYSLNFTVVPRYGTLGSLVAWPTGLAQPLASTLTSPDGSVLANAALVPAGDGGSINVNATDDTDVVIDINGYFVPPAGGTLQFYPLPPCRVLDTRNAAGTFGGPSLAASSRSFPVASSSCGASPAAAAYSFNVTVVPRGPLGFLTAWPTGQPQPLVSTMNSYDGTVLANAAIVPAGAGGAASFFATNATDLVVDINGYFAPPGAGGLNFYTVAPCRLADTRNANGILGGPTMGGATTRSFPLAGQCGLPGSPIAQAYSLSMTVIPQGILGYLSTWPTGSAQPVVSTLNAWKGQAVANAALVPAGAGGSIDVFVTTRTDLIIDTAGYFGQ